MTQSALNVWEKLLQDASNVEGLVKHTFSKNTNTDITATDPNATGAGILGDLASQLTRVVPDVNLLYSFLQTFQNGGVLDDKGLLIEHIVQLAASLPSDSVILPKVSDTFIKTLWNNLQHPPLSYLGDEWKYRTADGSNNNRMYPQLGKAGSPYARTVEPQIQLPPTLPDPGLIFDELFARGETTREHPTKVSSMLFYLASIIIHDIFRTSDMDPNRVENSSYLDLGPLYGNSEEQQKSVRTLKDGLLKPDAFAEIRLLGFPPGVATLLVCFNRFHNYIAGELATINEAGRFTLIPENLFSPDLRRKYGTPEAKRDNDLFQTARLITCGLYVNIILSDYVRTILNLNRSPSEWTLDPRENLTTVFGPSGIPEGIGNQVSVEFNLLYRWHSAISARDEQWSIDFYQKVFPGGDPNTATIDQLKQGLRAFLMDEVRKDPGERTFGDLKRQADGSFKDEDLVKILTESTDDVAGAFGARNVPIIMRAVEMLSIEQARSWNVATLNEFRKFFGLTPHKTFSDITSNPEAARSLEALYGDPDHVELYPGLVTEDAKPPQAPGSGLCPGYTISRAILSDAVALVRGDRFYTVDYNAATLTNWGFNEIQPNKQVAGGGVIYKLLMRAFPNWYRGGSVYAMFPFTVAQENRTILRNLGKEKLYDYSKPKFIPPPTEVASYDGVVSVLADQARFKVPWGPHTYQLTGHDYMLSGDSLANREQKAFVMKQVYSPKDGMDEVRKFYEGVTTNLIRERSHKLRSGYQIDAVADIANLSHSMFMAEMFHVPLKLPNHPSGTFTAQEFYTVNALLFAYVFLDFDTANSMALQLGAQAGTAAFGQVMKLVCSMVYDDHFAKFKELLRIGQKNVIPDYGTNMIRRLLEGGKSVDEVTWTIIPTIAAGVATQAQGLTQMLDLYLSDEYKHHWPHIQELAHSDLPEAFEKLKKYALEGYRLATPAFGLLRRVDADMVEIKDGESTVKASKNDQIFVNFVKACVDPNRFPDPMSVKLDRPESSYIHHGWGPHACLGRQITVTAMASQLRVLGRLRNLRRVPGPQGQLKYKVVNGAFRVYLKPDWSAYWPFPTTMKVMYDGFEDAITPGGAGMNGSTMTTSKGLSGSYGVEHGGPEPLK